MGVQTAEYMAPIGQPIETLDECPQSAIIGEGDCETLPQGPCITGQPIKKYGPALHVMGRWGKAPPRFSLISEPPGNILILF